MPVTMRQAAFKTLAAGATQAPRGLESLFEYNGLVLNDRRVLDGYMLTRVTGLDDADVRDSREINPDRDGETPFGGLYGGRTIVLQGEVVAGNLDYLRYLWRNLKAAFDDISIERPLLIRWNDYYDNFAADTAALALADYVFDSGAATQFVFSGASLMPNTLGQKKIIFPNRQYSNYDNVWSFTTSSSVATTEFFGITKRADANNHLFAGVLNGTTFSIQRASAGSSSSLTSAVVALATSTTYFLRMTQSDNVITAYLYTSDPFLNPSATPISTLTTTLAGANATQFGTGTSGSSGFRVNSTVSDYKINYFDWRAADPGDLVVYCRKIARLESDEAWNGWAFVKPFLLTLRSSSSLMVSRLEESASGSVASAALTFPGGGTGIPFDSSGAIFFGATAGSLTNLGTAPSPPTVRLNGPLTNPAVVNLTNGNRVSVEGVIVSGSSLIIDCDKRTVVDENGVNKYDLLSDDNTWMELEAGANAIATGADATGGTYQVTWRHAFR